MPRWLFWTHLNLTRHTNFQNTISCAHCTWWCLAVHVICGLLSCRIGFVFFIHTSLQLCSAVVLAAFSIAPVTLVVSHHGWLGSVQITNAGTQPIWTSWTSSTSASRAAVFSSVVRTHASSDLAFPEYATPSVPTSVGSEPVWTLYDGKNDEPKSIHDAGHLVRSSVSTSSSILTSTNSTISCACSSCNSTMLTNSAMSTNSTMLSKHCIRPFFSASAIWNSSIYPTTRSRISRSNPHLRVRSQSSLARGQRPLRQPKGQRSDLPTLHPSIWLKGIPFLPALTPLVSLQACNVVNCTSNGHPDAALLLQMLDQAPRWATGLMNPSGPRHGRPWHDVQCSTLWVHVSDSFCSSTGGIHALPSRGSVPTPDWDPTTAPSTPYSHFQGGHINPSIRHQPPHGDGSRSLWLSRNRQPEFFFNGIVVM